MSIVGVMNMSSAAVLVSNNVGDCALVIHYSYHSFSVESKSFFWDDWFPFSIAVNHCCLTDTDDDEHDYFDDSHD